jgi:hypothetical protein
MSTILKKTNPLCSNVDLIDSNSCLGDSLIVINKNFSNLEKTTRRMINSVDFWTADFGITSYFHAVSSKLISMMYNIQTINDVYKSPYSTIQSLSSQWGSKEFSVYYPEIIDLVYYYSNTSIINEQITYWFINTFPPDNFSEGQIINIFITLSYSNYFDFTFNSSYNENCSPTSHSDNNLSCNGCGGDSRNAGCNHDARNRHWCDNAYSYCKQVLQKQTANTYSCTGYVGETFDYDTYNGLYSVGNSGYLQINYQIPNIEDRFVSRIVKFKAKNKINDGYLSWEVI